ncbi:hypothetical protein N42_0152 [Lactococcus lactis subsp. lactis]|uniref:Uncharacterized protein n=1 Tax=Lactococcus lactis subsp. lactis TaxID=1360 RepID=A0A0V8EV71_LACLL|nr:hypothetical protein N42_0152 [Lactococcus lactis subsp. lactis]
MLSSDLRSEGTLAAGTAAKDRALILGVVVEESLVFSFEAS